MTQPWVSRASASLGAGSVVLVEGSSFCISLPSGDVVPDRPQGLFFRDTRFLSELRVRINECWPEPLAAHTTEPFAATFVLRDCPPPGRAASELLLVRRRYVGRGLREDVTLHNFDTKTVRCVLELDIDADFADVFEVKEGRVAQDRAHSLRSGERSLEFTYRHGSFNRATTVTLSQVPQLRERTARYELAIPPGAEWSTCVQVTPVLDRQPVTPRYRCGEPVEQSRPSIRLAEWRRDRPVITSDVDAVRRLFEQSSDDLAALRLFDPEFPERTVVAAGAPWFMTLFGRDSLITSWMALPIDPDLAFGTLQTLARFQGHRVNPVTEEQPGRILHEMRFGENATLSLGGGRVYYGSVDASPLFVMLLAELRRWGHRRGELDALLLAADAALTWIDEYGDADGDGYLEYERAADHGLRNQSWKDSWDAVRFADGRPAEPPIAMCEVQGYTYAALLGRASFADDAGDARLAASLRTRAADLKQQFNRDFWLPDRGWFAMGLDRRKTPIDALTSNIGHCLWTGIVDDDKAARVADLLVGNDCFSGWGVRTVATTMSGYNPISYHNGSVWPHDNALIAAGLVRYGHVEQAHRVMRGIVEAAAFFDHRLPELFAGLARDDQPFPVPYPTSCSPQAWAAATPFLLLRTALGLQPDAPAGTVRLQPRVPAWMGSLSIDRLRVAGGYLSLHDARGTWTVTETPDRATVEQAGDERR